MLRVRLSGPVAASRQDVREWVARSKWINLPPTDVDLGGATCWPRLRACFPSFNMAKKMSSGTSVSESMLHVRTSASMFFAVCSLDDGRDMESGPFMIAVPVANAVIDSCRCTLLFCWHLPLPKSVSGAGTTCDRLRTRSEIRPDRVDRLQSCKKRWGGVPVALYCDGGGHVTSRCFLVSTPLLHGISQSGTQLVASRSSQLARH